MSLEGSSRSRLIGYGASGQANLGGPSTAGYRICHRFHSCAGRRLLRATFATHHSTRHASSGRVRDDEGQGRANAEGGAPSTGYSVHAAHGVSTALVPDDERMEFLCECDDTDCVEKVSGTPAEYEAIRAVATHFVVLPGHEDPAVEHVVQQTERFLVVEKEGEAAHEAEESNPRET
jgi:hypothetical protein